MKKFMKLVSIVLALIMTVIPLTGCTEDEIGLLNMIGENGANIASMDVTQEIVVDLSELLTNEIYASLFADLVSPKDYPDKLTISLTGKMNDQADLDSVIEIKLGDLVKFKSNYIAIDDDIYFGDFEIEYDSDKINAELVDETRNEAAFVYFNMFRSFEDVDYFVFSLDEMMTSMLGLGDLSGAQDDLYAENPELVEIFEFYEEYVDFLCDNATELYPVSVKMIENALPGYTTGVVSKTENGYKISADIEDMAYMLVDYIEYIVNNLDTSLEAISEFFDDMAKLAKEKDKNTVEQYLLELKGQIDILAEQIPDDMEEVSAEDMFDIQSIEETCALLDGTNLEYECSETDGVFTETAKIDIIVYGLNMGTIDYSYKAVPCEKVEVSIEEDASVMSILDAVAYINAAESIAEMSYIEEMSITWDGTEGTAQVYGKLWGDTSETKYALGLYDFHNIDGSMYLPMRRICERFGEVVDWDGVNGKAYVVRGEEKIDMTGIIIGDKTFIKIRDFEKLGYIVDYYVDEHGKPWAVLNVNYTE